MPAQPCRSIGHQGRGAARADPNGWLRVCPSQPEAVGDEMVQQTREVTRSEQYFEAAKRVLPGGVTAAARLHRGTGRPFVAAQGEGAHIWDVDGNEYIDFCM